MLSFRRLVGGFSGLLDVKFVLGGRRTDQAELGEINDEELEAGETVLSWGLGGMVASLAGHGL
ncbi:MAG TPA: hypothetical protein VFQ43_17140 [Nitrososphaera sp.]|nr:hypothetical protein [Nitrososphaera sp.]